jgi:hypothetical protein
VALTRMTEDLQIMKAMGATADSLGPQYIAPVACFLASDLAADITGEIVGVQGPFLFRYRMGKSEGVTGEGLWSPKKIKEMWPKIVGGPLNEI